MGTDIGVDVGGEPTLDELTPEECLALLGDGGVGRLAVNAKAGPLVVPVNYAVAGETIVFRSGPGLKLRSLAGRPVSFQVDEIDLDRREGWSVLARGRAREVSARAFRELPVDPWWPKDKDHWVAIKVLVLTGRRLVHGAQRGAVRDPRPASGGGSGAGRPSASATS